MKNFCLHTVLIFAALLLFSCAKSPVPVTEQRTGSSSRPAHEHEYSLSGQREIIASTARQSIGTPYKWGGLSPETGFDCSGLVVYSYSKVGIPLPRTAKDQLNHGKSIPQNELKAADLIFFRNPYSVKSFHVGLYIDNGIFIHAPGRGRKVRYESLSNPYFKKHYIDSRSYL